MSPRLLTVREAMVSYLINQGWSPEGAELMSWAMHPFDKPAPPCTRSLQKKVKKTADAVGQRGQRLEEPQATQLAANALASYRQSALADGNEPLARFWHERLPAPAPSPAPGATAQGAPAPVHPAPPGAVAPMPDGATSGWRHAVTLPPGRLTQLAALDQPLEPVGRVAAQVLAAHLLAADSDADGTGGAPAELRERAALAGYLVDLDLAGVTPDDVATPTDGGLALVEVRAALAVLRAGDLAELARTHSPAAQAVLARLVGSDPVADHSGHLACDLGAGLRLAELQRSGA
jgi:hypothetical protein